jgi:hypothetical protein
MFKKLAVLLAAVTISATLVPSAEAARADVLRVDLNAGSGIEVVDDYWVGDPHAPRMEFTVTMTDVGNLNDENGGVFVSVPDDLEVTFSWGNRWECIDVTGGIVCESPDLVVPGESWPKLTVSIDAHGNEINDTIDAYAYSQRQAQAHDGVPFHIAAP